MQRVLLRFGALPAAVAAIFAVSACGDDDQPAKSKDAGSEHDKDAAAPGMTRPTGGRSGSGGAGGAGGSGTSNSTAYTCQPRRGDVGGPSLSGDACCGGNGTCVGAADNTSGLPHETCKAEPDLRCLPKPGMPDEDAGTSTGFASCRVQLPGSPAAAPSYEGRCLGNCFVQASPIATRLSQATCAEGESCAPCYNPLNGRSTGICELPGDSPLDPPPVAFTECGSGNLGYCVPSYAAGNSAGQLSQLTCQAGELCAPKNKVADPSACFDHCDAGTGLGAGACAPTFLAGALSSVLTMSTCHTGEVCIPCEALGVRTGVCD